VVFNVSTPENEPLSGIGSCTCYLARALASRGHHVSLVSELPSLTPRLLMGVEHISIQAVIGAAEAFFGQRDFDVVVAINDPKLAAHVRRAIKNRLP